MSKHRVYFRFLAVLGIVILCSFCSQDKISRVERLHREALVWDAHSDIVQSIMLQGLDMSKKNSFSFQDLPRMEEGGLDVQIFALWTDRIYAPRKSARRTLQMLDVMLETIDETSDKMELAMTAADIERIVKSGKIAALIAIEGGHAIEDDLKLLSVYHRLGVSSMTLTHTNSLSWADSSGDEALSDGLNSFGEDVVREMNRLGMVIDISHVSDATFYDVLKISRHPVMASHSNCRTLCDHTRNMSDDMIKALAENGGVICITFVPDYTTQLYKDARAVARLEANKKSQTKAVRPDNLDEWAKQRELEPRILPDIPFPTVDDVINQIDYAVKLVGVDYVAIGHDYSVMYRGPTGLEDVSKYQNLTKGLLERGYSERDIRKILGENLLRVWKKVTER